MTRSGTASEALPQTLTSFAIKADLKVRLYGRRAIAAHMLDGLRQGPRWTVS